MDEAEFIRERVRQARKDAGLSQREIAKLLSTTQSTISDIERGRVQVNADDLAKIAKILGKPITYFYPAEIEADTDQEAHLLNLFRSVPEKWQDRILTEARTQVELCKRMQPYERAGIPDEFYGLALLEEHDALRFEEIGLESLEAEEIHKGQNLFQRYTRWLESKRGEIKSDEESEHPIGPDES